ncbi:TerD family protein, partial [Streptomyces sp. YIM 98790]|uniref:TerD family protein n=1 Tax=Streptomyces sp. YIM 98790 TaxID=2689077 RepID=UPI001A9FFC37
APPPPAPGPAWATGPQPQAPAPAPGGPAGGVTGLGTGPVSLVKNQAVSLVKAGQPPLARVQMGLGWQPAMHGGRIDLDASVIAFDSQRRKIDTCWFMKQRILGGAIRHSGDNLTGHGEGDDEAIGVDLAKLPPEVSGLVFTVNSFSGQKFTSVARAYCRLLDAHDGSELARYDLTQSEPRTGLILCKLVRQFSGEWHMTAVGVFADAKTAKGMVKHAAAIL